jgi:hypothetical protein
MHNFKHLSGPARLVVAIGFLLVLLVGVLVLVWQ